MQQSLVSHGILDLLRISDLSVLSLVRRKLSLENWAGKGIHVDNSCLNINPFWRKCWGLNLLSKHNLKCFLIQAWERTLDTTSDSYFFLLGTDRGVLVHLHLPFSLWHRLAALFIYPCWNRQCALAELQLMKKKSSIFYSNVFSSPLLALWLKWVSGGCYWGNALPVNLAAAQWLFQLTWEVSLPWGLYCCHQFIFQCFWWGILGLSSWRLLFILYFEYSVLCIYTLFCFVSWAMISI